MGAEEQLVPSPQAGVRLVCCRDRKEPRWLEWGLQWKERSEISVLVPPSLHQPGRRAALTLNDISPTEAS